MMKKLFSLSIAALATIGLASCTQEVAPEVSESGNSSFSIFASTPDTKTAVNEDMNGVVWSAKDSLNIFHAAAGSTTYENDGGFAFTSDNTFNGEVSGELSSSNDWYAFYPYISKMVTPGAKTVGYATIGSAYNGVQKQNGNDDMSHLAGKNVPLYGKLSGVAKDQTPSFSMNQVASVVAVKVKNTTSSPLTVTNVQFTAPDVVVGTFYVDFAGESLVCTSSDAKYVASTAILNVIGASALAQGAEATYYLAIRPFDAAAGQNLQISVNGYEKTIDLTKAVSFVPGKIKTIGFYYDKGEETLPSVNTEKAVFIETFEESFVPGTTYNNSNEAIDGPEGAKWATYYGTVSTNSKLSGNNSMQLRWYTSTAAALGYTKTLFSFTKVKMVSFSAAATNGLNVSLYYNVGSDWTLAQTFTLSSSTKVYKYVAPSTLENAQLMFKVSMPEKIPTSTSNVRVDDIKVYSAEPVLESLTISDPSVSFEQNTAWSFGGTVTANYSDGSIVDVTSRASFSGYDTSVLGNQTVTVTYSDGVTEKSATYLISVSEKSSTSKVSLLTNENIINAGDAANGYAEYSLTSSDGKTYAAYAIKNFHSNATKDEQYLQIKKYASGVAYYVQIPELSGTIKSIKMTVSSSSLPMTGAGNSATLFFSSSKSTAAAGEGVVSGTGTSTVSIDASDLGLSTGFITANGAVRIWDIQVTYE